MLTNEQVIRMAISNGWTEGEAGVTGEQRWLPPNKKVLCYIGAVRAEMEKIEMDAYGNPIDGSIQINCSYPDCGCASARVCMVKQPNFSARSLNREHRNELP